MKILKCIAVDDESPALVKIEHFVSKIPFLELLNTFTSGFEALEYLKNNYVDLVFLDIQMDDISGINVIESMKERPLVILTTAYSSYAVTGFQYNVCDYLLKPFDFDRFLQASTRALNDIEYHENTGNKENGKTLNSLELNGYIFVKSAFQLEKVMLGDILFLRGMREYIQINMENKKIMTLSTFSEMEKLLPPKYFFRIHKSYIVAVGKIDAISRKRAILGKEYLPISNTYYDSLIHFLKLNNTLI